MITVAVLGAVEFRRDGVLLPVPTGKTTELLVRLALDAGTRVRTDVLVEDLWGKPVSLNTLQSKVSQLRRAVGDPALVVGSGDAYTLAVPPSAVDALRVTELAASASAAWEGADPAAALDLAREGVTLFGGVFAGGVLAGAGDWSAVHRARLTEVRLELLELLMAARIELGSGADAVAELQTLVELHPLREGLWASLVTALYRAGRQADALSAYTRLRTLLKDELGIEPGPELQRLEQHVLRQSPALHVSARAPSIAVPGNLPDVTAPLVGRQAAVATLAGLVRDHRLVTVVGTAGVGKTRVALEVARGLRASGGVWLVRFGEADRSSNLAQMVAETLHLVAGERSLAERLSGAETVLVFDNCEHLVDKVVPLAADLAGAAPSLRLLTTSQVPLGVDGEAVFQLEPLSTQDSVTLFAGRAAAVRPGFVLDSTTGQLVLDLCRSLDGLPLAIELAAARVRSLSLHDIARRLDDRFALLRDPSSHRVERSRALGSAIAWSYDLLFPDDQRGLWAVSCFAGSVSLEGVEHVLVALGVPPGSVLDTVSRLVDRSLLGVDVGDDGSVRYRLLDSIRAFAADRARAAGQQDVAAAAGARWYAGRAAWCDTLVRGVRQPECLAFVRSERANIDATLAWCADHDPALGVQIANALGWTWVVLGDGTAGAARVRGALSESTPPPERVVGLLLAGWLEASAGDVSVAQADLDSALALLDGVEVGSERELLRADVHRHQAFLSIQQGDPQAVLSAAAASLSTYQQMSLPWQTAGSLLLAAFGHIMLGDTGAARRDAAEAKRLLAGTGDSWGLVHTEAMLGAVAQAERRFSDAVQSLREAAELSAELGFLGQAGLHLATLGRVQQRAGDTAGATASFRQALLTADANGDGRLGATARMHLARLHRGAGDHRSAQAMLEENQRWYAAAGGGEGELLNNCLLFSERGDRHALLEITAQADAADNREVGVYARDALALLAVQTGDRRRADQLLDEADALAGTVTHLVDDLDRVDAIRARGMSTGRGGVSSGLPGPARLLGRPSDEPT